VKVLFVGEGPQDIGTPRFDPQPRPARGVVCTLARKVCPEIAADSLALAWREIPVFDKDARKRGLERKVARAIALSAIKFGCVGTVCVTDHDRDERRLSAMDEGRAQGLQVAGPGHQAVCGVAVEFVEAWTLGDPEAIAAVLEESASTIRQKYREAKVEDLYQNSGKPENRPKDLLEQIASLKRRKDCAEFREEVAAQTQVAALEKTCSRGFKPFAERLRAAFGPRATPGHGVAGTSPGPA
jgi:hypothetical protein